MKKWLITLPPYGAARQAAFHVVAEFGKKLHASAVHTFDCKKYLDAFNALLKTPDETIAVDLLNQSLIVQSLQYRTTHLLVMALSPITLFTLNLLKMQHIKTIHWFIEDYRSATYWQQILPGYDIFFAIQKGILPSICSKHHTRYDYLPTAATSVDTAQQPDNSLPRYDAAFVGIPSPYRITVLEYLLKHGISLSIAGEGWDCYSGPLSVCIKQATWTNAEQTATLLREASIGLNLSFNEPCDTTGTDTQLSPRVFDILLYSKALLSENSALLQQTLHGCHYYTFSNKQEAVTITEKILRDQKEQNYPDLVTATKNIVQQKHLWEHRVDHIIAHCTS